jgi:hypothetical protein
VTWVTAVEALVIILALWGVSYRVWQTAYVKGWTDGVEYARQRRAAESPVGTCRHCGGQPSVSQTSPLRDVSHMNEGEINATVREWARGRF